MVLKGVAPQNIYWLRLNCCLKMGMLLTRWTTAFAVEKSTGNWLPTTVEEQKIAHSNWTLLPNYEEIYLVGFSLGGNLVLKYNGDGIYPLHPKIKASVAVSVPVDLHGSSIQLQKPENKIYTWRFLRTLAKKIRLKHQQYPDEVDLKLLKKIKKLIDFDEYTSQLTILKMQKTIIPKRVANLLSAIQKPTLLINALDDPFYLPPVFLWGGKKQLPFLFDVPWIWRTCRFYRSGGEYHWSEKQSLRFSNNFNYCRFNLTF